MRTRRNTPEKTARRTRLALVALIAFALGAGVDRMARITSYDQVVTKMGHTIETQRKLIDTLQAERPEMNTILTTPQTEPRQE